MAIVCLVVSLRKVKCDPQCTLSHAEFLCALAQVQPTGPQHRYGTIEGFAASN